MTTKKRKCDMEDATRSDYYSRLSYTHIEGRRASME